ncbi:gpW family head-tail joining protein [Photobacterium sanguinicancri]|uniref:gpW family head-tail joining protein n=1 Tax=Photobacterium sanguinicancri TaxID=875932 RepID=UPI0026E23942|nr:gpW family head-tail joining protein [Photobacterium sanguinicancri]MDO6498061.1 gpW family head-tail joining protein [Photobacterium sanguinicancri]
MQIYATAENLQIVQNAITELVQGKRQVKAEYVTANGYKSSVEYTSVSLNELRQLAADLQQQLQPVVIMESIDVEIEF